MIKLTEEERKRRKYEYTKKWKAKNKEAVAAYQKEYDKNYYQENKGKVLANKKRYAQENKDKVAVHSKNWKQKNNSKVISYCAKRRASKINATPLWFNKTEVELMYEISTMITELSGEQHHVDHIVPLHGKNVCGLHTVDNLQVISATQNLAKSNTYEINS